MEEKVLPVNWEEMSDVEKTMWFIDNFGTDEDDEYGYLIYDTDSMTEEVLEEFNKLIEGRKKERARGIFFD